MAREQSGLGFRGVLFSLLFLASGATALVYQVTWVRDLGLIFGSTFEATSVGSPSRTIRSLKMLSPPPRPA